MILVEDNPGCLLVDLDDITNKMRVNGNRLPAYSLLKGYEVIRHMSLSTLLRGEHGREAGGASNALREKPQGAIAMNIRCALFALLMALPALPSQAQPAVSYFPELQARGVSCADFRHNFLGSWTPIRKVTIVGPSGPFTVEPDEVFSLDSTVMSVNIAAILDERCL
jgi:hypothetical protein